MQSNKFTLWEKIKGFFCVIAALFFVFWASNELFGDGFHNITNSVGNGLLWLLR